MGLFSKVFGKNNQLKKIDSYFKTFDAYRPVFKNWNGALYESELVRASVDSIARHISKLSVKFEGSASEFTKNSIKYQPNPIQTWSQWLYRTATILFIQGNAYIVPSRDEFGRINGIYTIVPSECGIAKDKKDNIYLTYKFKTGDVGACEISQCGILTRHQYKSEFFGENQKALTPTMELINIYNQSIQEGAKSSATYKFMATITNFISDEDLETKKKNFNSSNFGVDGSSGGLLLFPNEFSDVKQISQTPFTLSAEQMKIIHTNVFNYFGVNEKILQNSASDVELDSFFNGCIEPFSIQLSEVLTRMLFTGKEYYNNRVLLTANRLQYMSVPNKINLITNLSDRGFISINEGRELLNYAPLPDDIGDKIMIRGEYYDLMENNTTEEEKLLENENKGDKDNE